MASIFTKIIRGEIPCFKILEDEKFLAFLDVRPITKGHTLVIPKQEIDYFFDLDSETLSGLMLFAKQAAKMIEKKVSCKRIGVMVAGLEVPHVHVHLVPISSVQDLNFAKAEPADEKDLALLSREITSS
jgi:histidine triad (HIT) family protein